FLYKKINTPINKAYLFFPALNLETQDHLLIGCFDKIVYNIYKHNIIKDYPLGKERVLFISFFFISFVELQTKS
ncbi:hypothetical protein, partial [Mycoplasmopsis pullorum]|uniref:hypothetical protein n=1 Tax=Mycoplasmopsis pullorum TaxID=48003 RepID=UPI001C564CF9